MNYHKFNDAFVYILFGSIRDFEDYSNSIIISAYYSSCIHSKDSLEYENLHRSRRWILLQRNGFAQNVWLKVFVVKLFLLQPQIG